MQIEQTDRQAGFFEADPKIKPPPAAPGAPEEGAQATEQDTELTSPRAIHAERRRPAR